MIPAGAERLGAAQDVLLAVVAIHHQRGQVTIRDVCGRTGLRSTSTVKAHLDRLRALGWVEWEDGRHGTLRPTVRPVAFDGTPRATDATAVG